MSQHLKGILITVLGVIILSPDAVLIRLADSDGWALLFWRGLSYAIGVSVIVWMMHGSQAINVCRKIGKGGLLIGFLAGITAGTFLFAIEYTSIANTLVIISTSPVMIAIIAWIMLKEKVSFVTFMAMAIVFIGIYIVMSESFGGSNFKGDIYALITSIMMGVTFTLTRKYKNLDMIPTNIVGGVVAAVIALVFADSLTLTTSAMIYIIASGVILSISFSLIVMAPRYIPAAEVGMIMPLETVLGTLIAWIAINEVPSSSALVGGSIVIVALFLHALYSTKLAKNS
jgi:drug/metabolite transporter (DMT)-like permease